MDAWLGGLIGGAGGAVIGHFANHAISWVKETVQSNPERKFICVELIFKLEEFARKCEEVARDYGQPQGEQGEYEAEVKCPDIFDYSLIKGNWKALKPELIYRICNLPVMHREARHQLSWAGECATPPDFSEYFEVRRYEYALLGLEAATLATDLRRQSKFPEGNLDCWIIPSMIKERDCVVAERKKREARFNAPPEMG